MPTPTTTENTRRVSELEVDILYRTVALHMRPTPDCREVDVLVPWRISNIYLLAAEVLFGRRLQCEQVMGPHGELLAYITGQL